MSTSSSAAPESPPKQTTFDHDNSQALAALQDKYDDALTDVERLKKQLEDLEKDYENLRSEIYQVEQYTVDQDGDPVLKANGELVLWGDIKKIWMESKR